MLAFAVLALAAPTAVLGSLPGHNNGGSAVADERVGGPSRFGPEWKKDVTAHDVSREMGLEIPDGAERRRAAWQENPREDILLLSFQLPSRQLPPFAEKLDLETPLAEPGPDSAPDSGTGAAAPFGHLGLPEPETVKGVRKGSSCPPCTGNKKARVGYWEIFTQPLEKERARVYLRAF
ncbi:hypothetical protein GCM10009863_60490 [Streptomyces axinellae]|uniref:Uncharacterized protein n=1 Tax=Streptomyces axinellae TaxID=552788 RepID=A0ABN3QVM1_9ACTN